MSAISCWAIVVEAIYVADQIDIAANIKSSSSLPCRPASISQKRKVFAHHDPRQTHFFAIWLIQPPCAQLLVHLSEGFLFNRRNIIHYDRGIIHQAMKMLHICDRVGTS
ncbi:MAG: hypothetical protein V4523_11840 [Pseudomonadota bacterium]